MPPDPEPPEPPEPPESPEQHSPEMRWAATILATEPAVGPVRVVCIDGPAGSGKSTLAARLAAALRLTGTEIAVVRGDDLYEGWEVVAGATDRTAAFALLGPRVLEWLVTPWEAGAAGVHPVWDWHAGSWGPSRRVAPAAVAILEGVGLAARPLRTRSVLSLWVDSDAEGRLARVLDRDGEALRAEMVRWQVDEARWHAIDGTRAGADERITT